MMPAMTTGVPDSVGVDYYLAFMRGGGDGMIRDDSDLGLVEQNSPLAMNVLVGTFYGFVNHRRAKNSTQQTSSTITGPTGGSAGDLRRIDVVQWKLGVVDIKTGTESASPSAPSKDADCILLAHIYCRKGMTTIKNSDDASNGYIDTTVREFV